MNRVMKNLTYIVLLWMATVLASCFQDDSSLGTREVGAIKIAELKDTSMISYSGKVLRISPKVEAGYPEAEMSYAWYIYGGSFEEKNDYRAYPIGEEKELAYEVNLPSGSYTVVFEATAGNSYAQNTKFSLTVSTPFSQGFYILKETAEGNTELDLSTKDGLVENLMESLLGESLKGKPIGLSVIYDNGYIDDRDLEMKADNMVHVFTEQDYRAFRTEDMYQTFSRDNLMFEPVPADETFCAAIQDPNGICFLSNKGFYRSNTGVSSGKLGVPDVEGGSKFIQSLGAGQAATVFWNEETHGLGEMTDGDWSERYELPSGFDATNLECLASGLNHSTAEEIGWFLCADVNTGKRLLFMIKAEDPTGWGFYEVTEITVNAVAADKHLATGNVIGGNGLDASAIYVADNSGIYLFDLATQAETSFPLQGIEGEIVYVSNNYLNINFLGTLSPDNFNYLLVGTQKGDQYNLYFYDNLVGGIPVKAPKQIITGTGTVKGVRYLSTTLTSADWNNIIFMYTGPLYPFGD